MMIPIQCHAWCVSLETIAAVLGRNMFALIEWQTILKQTPILERMHIVTHVSCILRFGHAGKM